MEIECGIQPNCSEAIVRLITDKLSKRQISLIKGILQSLSRDGDNLSWGTDELNGTHGITISGDMLYNNQSDVLDPIIDIAGDKYDLDERENELWYGCSYINEEDVDDPLTCYDCESRFCPYGKKLPKDMVEIGWKTCSKCSRALYFSYEKNRWYCIWKPCKVSKKASPPDIARVIAEELQGVKHDEKDE